jgi:cytochrome c oxidase subunit 2
MQSTDIIHAFWVPEFRVKQDVVPFNTNDPRQSFRDVSLYDPTAANYTPTTIRITPTMTGVFRVRCAEICGTQHYAMLAHVHVLSSADYQAWLNGELVLPTDPGVGNTQPLTPDGRVNDTYYIPELEQYCANKYGNKECIGN